MSCRCLVNVSIFLCSLDLSISRSLDLSMCVFFSALLCSLPSLPPFLPLSPPGTSQAFGPGLVATVAGEKAYFTVRLRDQFQNVRRNRSSLDFDLLQMVAVHHVSQEMYYATDKTTVDTQDATYAFSYVANKTGTVALNVSFLLLLPYL